MRKLAILVAAAFVVACFASPSLAVNGIKLSGKHYNLNVIGFSNCDMTSMDYDTDDGCFKGNAPYSNGHRIFVPLVTAQTRDICNSEVPTTTTDLGDEVTTAELAKGVRILVSDGEDIGVTDFDATDGLGKFTLPYGEYLVFARAVGKPGKDFPYCMELNTLICYDETFTGSGIFEHISCTEDIGGNDKYVLVGSVDVKRQKGIKPQWQNVTNDLLPDITGSKYEDYFSFLWLIYNDHLRVLQLRFYEVPANG